MAVKCRVHRIGSNSLGFTIPQAVAKSGDFEPGTRVVAKLTAAGPEVELRVSRISKTSVGIIVPKAVLKQYGLEKGSEFMVPFREWRLAGAAGRRLKWHGFNDWATAQFGPPPVPLEEWEKFREDFVAVDMRYHGMKRQMDDMRHWLAMRNAALCAWAVKEEDKGAAR